MFDDAIYCPSADWVVADLAQAISKALHFELCPGGYFDCLTIPAEISDPGTRANFIEIRIGIAGSPAMPIASYQTRKLVEALEDFFALDVEGRPLWYCGRDCFQTSSIEHLVQEIKRTSYLEDDEDIEYLHRVVEVRSDPSELMPEWSFIAMNEVLGGRCKGGVVASERCLRTQ